MQKWFVLFFILTASLTASASNLDSFINEYSGRRPKALGPNCFGTTLAATSGYTYTGYISPEEFQVILNSPLCEEKSVDEDFAKGDIITVKKTVLKNEKLYSSLLHSSVYLEEDKVFEKESNSICSYPKTVTFKDSLKNYTEADLGSIRRTSEFANKALGTWILSYRCQSMESYLEANHLDWTDKNKRLLKKIKIEKENLNTWSQTEIRFIDALRASSQRLIGFESKILQSVILEKSDLLKTEEISLKDLVWSELPNWVSLLMLKRLQDMNRQVQYLIAAKLLENKAVTYTCEEDQ